MVVKDDIYGRYQIDSPLIIELIHSEPVQRLKKIAQYGIPAEFYHLVSYSRYEHCVGVMILLRRFGANEEEQIAGLLHDVSHTAFSHLVDWFVGSGEREDFQDRQHKQFIKKSAIAKILKKHGYSPRRIVNYDHFSLLEQPIPRLCADRLDYALREFPRQVTKKCLADLATSEGCFVFGNIKTAKLFAQYFLKRQREHWGGIEAVTRYTILAKTIRYAIKEKLVRFSDFWQYDEYILTKLRKAEDEFIQTNLALLRKRSLANISRSQKILRKKFRFVDPDVLIDNRRKSLSKLDNDFKQQLEKMRTINDQGIRIPRL